MKYIKLFEEMSREDRKVESKNQGEELKKIEPWLKSLGYEYTLDSDIGLSFPAVYVRTPLGVWSLTYKDVYNSFYDKNRAGVQWKNTNTDAWHMTWPRRSAAYKQNRN